MTIRNKILLWFMSMGLIPLLLVAVITTTVNKKALSDRAFAQLENARKVKTDQINAYIKERQEDLEILLDTVDSLKQAAFDKLKTAQENKKAQILTYFHKTEKDIEVISKSVTIARALRDFQSVISETGDFDTLLYDFFEAEKYGDTLVKFRDLYQYHDLLLATAQGRVVYASRRGMELGRQVTDPELAGTPLESCFKEGLTRTAYRDFHTDPNSPEQPVALIASPVTTKDNQPLGVVILKLNSDAIDEILQRHQGMGRTGETFLSVTRKGRATLRSQRPMTGGKIGDPVLDMPAQHQALNEDHPAISITATGRADIAVHEPVPVFGTPYVLSARIALNEVIDPRFDSRSQDYFSKYTQAYGYENLYLISSDGHIFYSAVTEPVLPSIGATGHPGLTALYKKCLAQKTPAFIDFSTSERENTPHAYIGAALKSDRKVELVVALKLSPESFNAIMRTQKNKDSSYDLYLVGPDLRFRSDSFLLPDTHTVARSFAGLQGPKADTRPVREALKGSTGTTIASDYRNVAVLSAFGPVDIMGTRWAILAEIDRDEAFASLTLFYILVCAATLVTAGVLFLFSLYATRRLTAPVLALKAAAERVKNTDYDIHVTVDTNDEFKLLAGAFNEMTQTVKARSRALELKETELMDAQAEILKSEERFRGLVETTSDWIWEVDKDAIYAYASPRVTKILGYQPEEIIGKTPFDLMPEEEQERVAASFSAIVAEQKPFSGLEKINIHKDGRHIHLETSGVPFFDESGRFMGYRGIDRDISTRKQNEEALLLTESVFTNTIEGIAITDRDGTIQRVNQAFCDITGYTREEAVGNNPRVLKSDRHDAAFYKAMWEDIIQAGQWSGEIWNRRKDGSAYPEWLSISAIRNHQGEITNFVSLFHDISDKKLQEEQLEFLAFHDPLTRLPNRKLLYDRAKASIRNARRAGHKMALLYMDLDNFKNINDSYGHPFGDEFLIQVKERISTICRESDTFARYGGDEFVIVLNNITRDQEVVDFSNRVLELFKTPVTIMDEEVYTSISIGLSIYPDDGEDLVTLEKHADMALYEAKRDGKQRSFLFKPGLKDKMLRKIKLENALRMAILDFATVDVAYQPKVDTTRGNRIKGVEALLRWSLDGSPVSPAEFIPLAEETNLILPIGEWLMKRAMADIKAIHDLGCPNLSLSINLSTKQFNDDHLFDTINTAIEDTGFPTEKLCFEITESIPMEDAQKAVRIMQNLANTGIQLSMDDFGTGYSSLSVLKSFPLNELKIDRSFVKDLPANENDASICKTIIHMAQALGFQVVAEGVETDAQLDFLKGNNCHLIQGYRFYKPMPAKELEALVNQC